MKRRKRLLSLLLCGTLCAGLLPGTVQAAGTADLTVNTSVVSFAGHDWWVIGDANGGVYPRENSITLLAKNNDWVGELKEESFNPRNSNNEYANSLLQQRIEKIAENFPAEEQELINARDLEGGGTYDAPSADGIAGPSVSGQKLWPLSLDEWTEIDNNTVRVYNDYYWLRSPSSTNANYAIAANGGYQFGIGVEDSVTDSRPAFSLDVSAALFTFKAGGDGSKATAVAGENLIAAAAADSNNPVKLTVKDADLSLSVIATGSQAEQRESTLTFSYEEASTGADRYVSCILTDSGGTARYYGRLADCSAAAEGELSIPLAGVVNGTYTLQIFTEQLNGEKYTDYCSEPITMRVSVADGTGTVSDFDGTVLHSHSWSSDWSSDADHHWHECQNSGCTITDNSQKDGYGEHVFDRQEADSKYLASAATETEAARYYYSCVCGAAGTETFTYGQPAGSENGDSQQPSDTKRDTEADTFSQTAPDTGDGNQGELYLWISLLLISGGALTGAAVYTRKRAK